MLTSMEWYERARKIMNAKGIVYSTLAADFSVSTATVGHWMTGARDPSVKNFRKIAVYLGTTTSQLLEEKESELEIYLPKSKKGGQAAKMVDEMKSEEKQDMAIKIVTTVFESDGNHGSASKSASK